MSEKLEELIDFSKLLTALFDLFIFLLSGGFYLAYNLHFSLKFGFTPSLFIKLFLKDPVLAPSDEERLIYIIFPSFSTLGLYFFLNNTNLDLGDIIYPEALDLRSGLSDMRGLILSLLNLFC